MLRRVVNIVLGGLLAVVLFMLLSVTVLPRVSNWQFLTVLTPSMTPTLQVGGIVAVGPTVPEAVNVGGVLVYQVPNRQNILVTHRVIEVIKDGGGIRFQTQGDANNVADAYVVPAANVVGTVRLHIPLMGYLLAFVQTPLGFLSAFVLPGLALISMEVTNIVREMKVARRRHAVDNRG